jgi:hypothetical protein
MNSLPPVFGRGGNFRKDSGVPGSTYRIDRERVYAASQKNYKVLQN